MSPEVLLGVDVPWRSLFSMETGTRRISTPTGYGDLPHGLSMKDSLAVALSLLALNTKKAGQHDQSLDAPAYPEARDQYCRLLNVVSEMQETKAVYEKVLNNREVDFDDDLIDLEAFLDDDTLMQITSYL
ncbi:UNVERIFIED_CONTAM: Calmodulin-binding transcription activator 3 [Sesamum calycinum]|uniref:Calmodulin-binding transcription activator 3 n=1 Tax=Sesamum calycinum TaxID=2727403 RepID=A0AAW2J0L1_9LAMI